MSDLNFGHLITTPQQRDAVHVAVAPVVAGEALEPGQHVGFTGDNNKVGDSKEPIGIVDPYLKQGVAPGEQFWLFLYPKTVTNLRHEWEHPAFANMDAHNKEAAEEWLKAWALDAHIDYDEVLEAADKYIKTGDLSDFGFDVADRCYEDIATFWKHYKTLTGKSGPETSTFWGCCV